MGEERTTRLAPSPTGALHLGNARTFLINWALGRQHGWRIVLRIEDLDTPRVKPGAAEQAITDLQWLGMDWDGPPLYQLADLSPYERALSHLRHKGLAYRCTCTRSQIVAAQSAPHADEHEMRYPGTCRDRVMDADQQVDVDQEGDGDQDDSAWRLITPDEEVSFTDRIAGPQRFNPQQQVGDFVIGTKAGLPAYQLAVVVDDARQGVTDVVRGDDLLSSAARQLLLYRLLDLTPLPAYWHVPLVLGADGRRLAKRHGDSRLSGYRQRGVPASRIIGLIASWCGLGCRQAMDAATFLQRFDPARVPRTPVTFTPEDDAWLLNG